MKKIYLTVLLGMIIVAFPFGSPKAQSACPGPNAPVARAFNFSGVCVVYIDHIWPNTLAVLLTSSLDTIGSAIADNSGFASIIYNCSKTPYKVSSCNAAVGGCCNTFVQTESSLPVKLTNFNAQLQSDNVVLLKWNSQMELSTFKYVVQKSMDGRTYVDIGDISSAGNSNKPVAYIYADRTFTGGAAFFRLKQIDLDGRFEYSKVIYVNKTAGSGIVSSVSPNPFISEVQLIGINSTELNFKNIRVYNNFGQTIPYRISGSNALEIDPSASRGIYFLRIKNQTFKLYKN